MKFVLLILLVFANNQTQTAATVTESEEDCKARMVKVAELIAENNNKYPQKIVWYSIACTEPIMAPKGSDL